MEASELIEIISRGEDSKHQFKVDINNVQSLSAEIVAFANASGGMIIIGVDDSSLNLKGLTGTDITRINGLISNTASQSVRPPINPITENIKAADKVVLVLSIPEGISKPYMDGSGAIWVKSGADKRKVTSREEMQRMFQSSGLIHADETPVSGMTLADLEIDYFKDFLTKEFGNSPDITSTNLTQLLENMNLLKNDFLNIAGALLFAKAPQYRLPVFIIKAISYPGSVIDESKYVDSNDLTGRLSDVFQKGMSFIVNNLSRVQNKRGVNSTGELEIPKEVFEELLVNALIHRDYFVSAPVRLMIFSDRIEIISPGHLPNNLTVENIKNGNSNIRNPILASFGVKLLPYRGLGSGIIRSLKAYPHIEFINDRDGNYFKVIIQRNQTTMLKNNEMDCKNFELKTETTETFKEQVLASMKSCKLKQIRDVNAIEMNTKLKEFAEI